MLLIESKKSAQSVDGGTRLLMLEKLQEKGLIPLIRVARLAAYELALGSNTRVPEMERAVAARTETDDGAPYVRGDLFFADDHALFLIFGSSEDDLAGMRAGIIYDRDVVEPRSQLEGFCSNVYWALDAARRSTGREETPLEELPAWDAESLQLPSGVERFRARHERIENSAPEPRPEKVERALEALADPDARRFLHRVIEAQADGRVVDVKGQDEEGAVPASVINSLAEAELLQRGVSVSCRQVGRSLFRLPSADALAVITSSGAVCSECSAAIADEKVEEVLGATERAMALLSDGSWLSAQLRGVLRELGVPDHLVFDGKIAEQGEAHLIANIHARPFLFIVRDGDWTPAHTHRALDELDATESRHLAVITTGTIQDQARVLLREHGRRQARRAGGEVEILLIEGMDAASAELQHAFERAAQGALAERLCELDSSLGLSVGYLAATRFRLAQKNAALTDLAESAIGAIAGSLREL